jgi:hypothetical protein
LTFIKGAAGTARSLDDKHTALDCQLHQNDEHKATEPAPAEQLHTSVSHIYHELEEYDQPPTVVPNICTHHEAWRLWDGVVATCLSHGMLACLADEKCYFRPLPVAHAAADGEGNEDGGTKEFTRDSYWYIVKEAKASLDVIAAAATTDRETVAAETLADCRDSCIAATWDCNSFNWQASGKSCVMYNRKLTVE